MGSSKAMNDVEQNQFSMSTFDLVLLIMKLQRLNNKRVKLNYFLLCSMIIYLKVYKTFFRVQFSCPLRIQAQPNKQRVCDLAGLTSHRVSLW